MINRTTIFANDNGVSLPELLVYVMIVSVVFSGAYTVYDAANTFYFSANTQAEAQGGGRVAVASITKHLRMAESFDVAGDYSIDLRADVDDDNLWDVVQYYLVGEKLYRRIDGGPEKLMLEGVRNQTLGIPIFTYYDLHGFALTADLASRITKTQRIEISLTIDSMPDNPPDAYVLGSSATLRNN